MQSLPLFQLKKFQSNKGRTHHETAQESDSSTATGPRRDEGGDNEQRPVESSCIKSTSTTSSLFGGSADPVEQPFINPTPPTIEMTATRVEPPAVLPSNTDPEPVYQSETLKNLSELSQKFDYLEQELGRPLHQPNISSPSALDSVQQLYESQIHELTQKLSDERQTNHSLETRLREQYSNVDELTLKLQHVELGSVTKVQYELGPLRDQLDNQIRTVAVLVGEKAQLSASLVAAESLSKSKELENEELHAKLGASRHQVQKLKDEMATMKKSQANYDSSQQNLCTEVETSRDELKTLRRSNDDLKEEILELRRKLDLREIDYRALEASHKEKLHEIDSLHLRLTQLVGHDEDHLQRDRVAEANAQQRILLEAQIQELLQQVERANSDRDTAATHYQNYVQQLNKEREEWIQKVQTATRERDELAQRDQQLVKHIGQLEKQMQQLRSMQAKTNHSADNEGEKEEESERKRELELQATIVELQNNMEIMEGKLSEEKENVQKMSVLLQSREETIEQLQGEAERLRNSHVDPQQISATLESEKVAASRAMTQNQQLRAQLEEMQTAFVQMTNDKANLMTELDAERYLGREMRAKYEEWDEEVKSLRQKLHFKDEEMIRLAHESGTQAKSILVLQQELDQMRRLEVNTRNQSHLQAEIVKQRDQISKLQSLIRKKETEAQQLNGESLVTMNGGEGVATAEELDATNAMEVSVAEEVGEELKTEVTLANEEEEEFIPESVEVQELPTGEAILKLQTRFTQTMNEIAELTEEKQRLEHLVIQLQGETETIGEYIALYQSQRKLLRQREIEKDIQVQKITADREEMKEKLLKLNELVEQMLAQRSVTVNGQGGHENGVDGGGPVPVAELAPGKISGGVTKENPGTSRETAEQILDLLTEIKTQNTNFLTDTIPTNCACCSGQLITV